MFQDNILMLFITKLDDLTKAKVVEMILYKRTEESLQSLSELLQSLSTSNCCWDNKREKKDGICCVCSKRKKNLLYKF